MREHLSLTSVKPHRDADELAIRESEANQASTWPLAIVELEQRSCARDVAHIYAFLA
jgi:hypothetical protein